MPSSSVPTAAPGAKAAAGPAPAHDVPGTALPGQARAAAVVAFVLRFAAVLIAKSYLFAPTLLALPESQRNWDFGYEMGRIARSIALGHGFGSPFHGWTGPTAWQPPLYPYLLAGIFRVFGVYSPASGVVVLAINCVAAGLSTILIYRIAERVGGQRVAFWSAWLWAILPWMMEYAVFWAWETEISIALLLLSFWVTIRLPEKTSIAAWLQLGAVWGAIALINTTLLSIMPFTLAWAWWQARQPHRNRRAAAAVVVVVVMIAPWILRDRMVMGKWMFMRDNLWAEVSFGNDVTARRSWLTWRYPGSDLHEFRHYADVGELNYLAERKRIVLSTFRRDPAFFARTTMQHFVVFWFGPFKFFNDNLQPDEVIDSHSQDICLSVLAWAGLILLLLRRRGAASLPWPGLLLAPILLTYPIVFYIATPDPRYRHIIEPFLLIFAAYAVVSRLEKPAPAKRSDAQTA